MPLRLHLVKSVEVNSVKSEYIVAYRTESSLNKLPRVKLL